MAREATFFLLYVTLMAVQSKRTYYESTCVINGGERITGYCKDTSRTPQVSSDSEICLPGESAVCSCDGTISGSAGSWTVDCGCFNKKTGARRAGTRRLQDAVPEECRNCSFLNKYEYINDGVHRTYEEAQQHCRDEFNSDLATIKDEQDLGIADALIGDGPTPWLGIIVGAHRADESPYYFTYVDGSDCATNCVGPRSDACVCSILWQNGVPLNCSVGSRCVRLMTDTMKIQNDISCHHRLDGVLCNCRNSAANSDRRRFLPSTDDTANDYNLGLSNKTLFISATIISFILINISIFICHWSLSKKDEGDIKK